MRIAVALSIGLAVAAAAGCGKFQRVETASQAETEMAGMTKEEVLACMGAPHRKEKAGNTEVWSYASGGDVTSIGSATGSSSRDYAYGSAVVTSKARYCVVNVVMEAGKVSAINYTGNTGGALTKGEQCAYAVQGCVQSW